MLKDMITKINQDSQRTEGGKLRITGWTRDAVEQLVLKLPEVPL